MNIDKDDVKLIQAHLEYYHNAENERKQKIIKGEVLNTLIRYLAQYVYWEKCTKISIEAETEAKKHSFDLKSMPYDSIKKKHKAYFAGYNPETKKIHFEHDLPPSQLVEELIGLGKECSEKNITKVLNNCRICIITKKQDKELSEGDKKGEFSSMIDKKYQKKGWTKRRPKDAYDLLKIKFI